MYQASDAYSFSDINVQQVIFTGLQNKPENNPTYIQLCADNDFIPTMKINFLKDNNFSGTPATVQVIF